VTTGASVTTVLRTMRSGQYQDYYADEDRAQRNTLALRDADYAIEAEFQMTDRRGPEDNPKKFDEMFRRRLEKGQFHMQPYLGCREFPAIVEPYDGKPAALADETRDLGLVLHDIQYTSSGNRPVFFSARLECGIMEVPEWEAGS
jgi:CRISPR-associated protein Cas5d